MKNPKRDALKLIHALPKKASWDEIFYVLYMQEAEDEGLLPPGDLNIRHEVVRFDEFDNEHDLFRIV